MNMPKNAKSIFNSKLLKLFIFESRALYENPTPPVLSRQIREIFIK